MSVKTLAPKWVFQGSKFIVAGDNGERQLLKIENDTDPQSSREWDNVGTMVCFHRWHSLGDEHNFSDPEDFLREMVRDYIPREKLMREIKGNKTNLNLSYNRSSREWELSGPCYWLTVLGSTEPKIEVLACATKLEDLYDSIIDELSLDTMKKLLEQYGELAMLPLYLYDHSGITMSTGAFSCPWDSGQVGWIYVSKAKVFEEGLGWIDPELRQSGDPKILNDQKNWEFPNEDNWRKIALHHLNAEVEIYDDYLVGHVYGFTLCELDEEGNEGVEFDSCWGFFGDEYERNGILDEFEILEVL